MNILDENIPESQRQLLRSRRIRARQIGLDIGRKGMKDQEQIIPLLQALPRPVLLTRDLGFYDQSFCHKGYGIVCLPWPPMKPPPLSGVSFARRRLIRRQKGWE